MKTNYKAPSLEVVTISSEDILNKSDLLIDGSTLFGTPAPTSDEE